MSQQRDTLAGCCSVTVYDDGSGIEVHFCDLHGAAPDLLEALKTLPLEAFDKELDACDAAEFVDNAGDFFDAMQKARVAIARAEGRS